MSRSKNYQSSTRWLLVGAMASEVLPVLKAMGNVSVVNRRFVTGTLFGLQVGLLRCGVGPVRAERRTRATLTIWSADSVLSFGTCGALADSINVGETYVVSALVGYSGPLIIGTSPTATLITVQEPVFTATRRRLLQSEASICDMEAMAVQRAAGEVPFGAIKVVSDLAGEGDDPRTSPASMLRFQMRATRLVNSSLLPRLLTLLCSRES